MSETVLITGALGGIGRATASLFRSAGWTVAGADRLDAAADASLDAYLQLDLARHDLEDELAGFIERLDGLHALVNNAAMQLEKPLTNLHVTEWDEVMATNLRGAFLAVQVAAAPLRRSGGAIVNVSSVHAMATSRGLAAYATSKGALAAFTRAAALELAPEVRVNAVLPGAVDTPMLRAGLSRWATADGLDDAVEALAARTPLRRIGSPEEIAEAILFLSDRNRSSFITGQTLVVDGGATVQLSTE